ncbi:MAG: hypothetical protein AAF236_11015 [Verrucomicrobiota bacterium]
MGQDRLTKIWVFAFAGVSLVVQHLASIYLPLFLAYPWSFFRPSSRGASPWVTGFDLGTILTGVVMVVAKLSSFGFLFVAAKHMRKNLLVGACCVGLSITYIICLLVGVVWEAAFLIALWCIFAMRVQPRAGGQNVTGSPS